ncbi:MAG: hypothetical protein BWK78_09720 [Thiotrichaceae bacterium IS1]|nr:MAG: hypothetical protein BWK78_09720 [Thiotrichaceae bacterium IS1]
MAGRDYPFEWIISVLTSRSEHRFSCQGEKFPVCVQRLGDEDNIGLPIVERGWIYEPERVEGLNL